MNINGNCKSRKTELKSPKDRTEIANQLVRAGMLTNGGGAIALLAFIQASLELDKFPDLAWWAAIAILVFVLGLFVAGAANYLRVKVSHADNDPDTIGKRFRIGASRAFQFGSIALFMAGCIVFAFGLFSVGLSGTESR